MHIKEITVNGFKAFANKEILSFQKGICALVGPNGSGKSNIIDAIKWVIGEQKISELRGERLEDLIFNGSQKFKPQNFAEVELHFDNSEKKFPISYNDLSVMRRMYRSGESEFFINRQSCRLKDIQDIFLNSGLGKSSYAIIPQGKIDQILSDKVEEKRKLFEEAAGIAKFRERKKEYEAKIVKAQENLVRVGDFLKQNYRRRDQLSKQSGDTAKYFDLSDKIKGIKIDILLHELCVNIEITQDYKNHIDQNQKKIEKFQDEILELKKSIQSLSTSLSSDDRDLNDLEKERIKNEQGKIGLHQERIWLEEGGQDTERILKNIEENLSSIHQDIEQNQKKITQNKEQVNVDKKNMIRCEKRIVDLETRQKSLNHELQTLEKEKKILSDVLKKKENERAKINVKEQNILHQLIKEIDSLKKDLEKKDIIAAKNNFRKKIDVLITDILSIDTDNLSEPLMKDRILEIKKRIHTDSAFLKSFFEEEKRFYTFFFSAEGTYSLKEKLLLELESILEKIEITRKNLDQTQNIVQQKQSLKEEVNRKAEQEKFNLSGCEQSIISIEKDISEKQAAILSIKEMAKKMDLEKNISLQKQKELRKKIEENNRQLIQMEKTNKEIGKKIDDFFQQQKDKRKKFEFDVKHEAELQQEIASHEQKNNEYSTQIQIKEKERESIYEKGYYQCSVDIRQYTPAKSELLDEKRRELNNLEKDLQTLGSVNPLAKEEFDEINLRIEDMEKQKNDILASISDLEKVVQETLEVGKKIFLETFREVNQNFSMLVQELFPGGEGMIKIGDEDDPLESEISVVIQPQGKKFQKLDLFSGGERSLIVLAFMFSFFLRNPSPFCLLDEVDAALDSNNIERFTRLLSKMQKYTQLILISHNQKTMQIVDYIYGFSMKEGVTKVLSLKVSG